FSRHGPRGAGKERIELALLSPLAPFPFGAGAFLEDFLHVARTALRLPEADHAIDLGIADERALDARWLARVDRLVEHVAPAEELLRSGRIEDHPTVHLGPDREGDARWN